MRRFLTLVFMFCLAIPAGITISGCTRNPGGNYCYGQAYGLKNTEVASITLEPQTAGISLAWGQTQQIQTPTAYTCNPNVTAEVNASSYTYGTTDTARKYLDITPTGSICAGTWNRNTGGGIADYTYCTAPSPLPTTKALPYVSYYITASTHSVTSNPVQVYLHAQVSSISLVGPQKCLSQTQSAQLDAQACYSSNGTQYLLCAPSSVTSTQEVTPACTVGSNGLSSIPTCLSSIGTLSYVVGTSSVATINANTNLITANLPGTTAITASISGTGSSAGYFSTCPAKSIGVTLADGTTKGVVTKGVTQNLTTKIVDTNDATITGLTLDYQSTNPIDISISTAGSVTANYPGVASVYAICQPSACNPAPINELGLYGTGLSIPSNAVNITTPGTISEYVWFAAPGQSQYFVPIELLTGTVGSTVRLPYVPNSMVMDKGGNNLYFGSSRELMVYSTTGNTLSKQDTGAPGVVLAVAPNNATVLINDQARQVFYLYNTASGSSTSFGGLGNAAAWTPDSKTLYITDSAALNSGTITGHTDTLYVYNSNTGWSTYALPPGLPAGSVPGLPPNSFAWGSAEESPNIAVSSTRQTPALTIPSVGAYLRGTTTVAHTWCPTGTVGDSSSITLYPQADSANIQSDVLTETTDGNHILAAALIGGGITLSDLNVTIPATACPRSTSGTTQTMLPLQLTSTVNQASLSGVNATAVNQLIASPVSNLAFFTYTGNNTGAQLPYYIPGTGGAAGTVGYVALTGATSITAPLAGAFTPDDSIFFVSTAGDNKIHYISIPTSPSAATPPTDSQQISPNLPSCTPVSAGGNDAGCVFSGSGTIVPATAIAVVPRSTT